MNPIDIVRTEEKILFQFGSVVCAEKDGQYLIYVEDRESGERKYYHRPTKSIHEAWLSFHSAVNSVMCKRIEAKYGPFSDTYPWVDPKGPSHYITNLKSSLIRPEYEQRILEVNGRANTPLSEVERLRFDLDMVEMFSPCYRLSEELEWKRKTIEIQYRQALKKEQEKRLPQQA